MTKTITPAQIMQETGLKRRAVYAAANRYQWGPPPYPEEKAGAFLTARKISATAQKVFKYSPNRPLIWPVTKCPACKEAAGYIGPALFCINGHYQE